MSWTLNDEEVERPNLEPPTISEVKYFSPLKTINNTLTGKGDIGATIQLYNNNEKVTNPYLRTTTVNSDGRWTILNYPQGDNTTSPLSLTATQTKTFEPPDDGTIGESIEITSNPSSEPVIVEFLSPPSITSKHGEYMIDSLEFNAAGIGIKSCTVSLVTASFGTWENTETIEHSETIVNDDGTWKITLPPCSFEEQTMEIKAIQTYKDTNLEIKSNVSNAITFKVETSDQHMERMKKTHNRGAEARNQIYIRKYQALQKKFGEFGITVEVAKLFFNQLMAREDPPSGIRPSLDDIFSRLRITDILRKQTGVTRDDWTAIIKAIKIEKRFITSSYHGFKALDADGSGEVTIDEAAELLVSHAEEEGGGNLEDAIKKVKQLAKTFDTDNDNTLSFAEFYKMILMDREKQRNKELIIKRKKKGNEKYEGRELESGDVNGSSDISYASASDDGDKKNQSKLNIARFKRAIRKVELRNSVWSTPARAVEDRLRLEKEKREKELKEKEEKENLFQHYTSLEAKEKAEKAAIYKKIADDQAKRLDSMEEERLKRVKETNRRIQANSGIVNNKNSRIPNAPRTKSPDTKSTLFRNRKRKPLSDSDLASMLLSASLDIFPAETTKNRLIPESITIAGCPHHIPKHESTDNIGKYRY